jgi:hypothetical protein
MLYAKYKDGVLTYPYNLTNLYQDNPHTSFPTEMWPGDIDSFGVVEVQATVSPVPTSTQVLVENTPVQVNGVWTQQWTLRDKTPEELAADTEQARLVAVDSTIASDNIVASLKKMTNAEFDAWWSANVTTAAQAIAVLKRITRVVIRRVL